MQLDRIRLPGPIDLVTLGVISVAPLSTWQQELFDPSRRENRRHVGLLIDRLSNRLGREAVVRALPQAEAQPELAVRYEPLAGARPSKSKQQFKPLPRPLRLETAPIPIEVLAVAPYGPPEPVSLPVRLPNRSTLGAGAHSNRLVARAIRAARLLPSRDGGRKTVLDFPRAA